MSPQGISSPRVWLRLASVGLTLTCFGFLGWSAYRLVVSGEGLQWGVLHGVLSCFVALVYSGLFVGLAFLFAANARVVSGLPLPRKSVAGLFLVTNLARYFPGNVFHLVGRHVQLHRKYQVPHGDLGVIQVLDLGMILAANLTLGVVAVLVFPIPGWQTALTQFGIAGNSWLWLLVAGMLGVALAVLAWGRRRFPVLGRLLRLRTLSALGMVFLGTTALYLLYGLLFAFLCVGLYPAGMEGSVGVIFGSFSLAFLLGFVLPGAPGGLGVREAVLVLCLSSTLGEAGALGVSLLFRASTLLGDVVAGGLGLWLGGRTHEAARD